MFFSAEERADEMWYYTHEFFVQSVQPLPACTGRYWQLYGLQCFVDAQQSVQTAASFNTILTAVCIARDSRSTSTTYYIQAAVIVTLGAFASLAIQQNSRTVYFFLMWK